MNVYIASRTKRINEARELGDQIKQRGHTITFEWYNADQPRAPKRHKQGYAAYERLVREELKGAAKADAFLLISDPGMRGAYVEMGAFLAAKFSSPSKDMMLIVIGGEEEAHIFETVPFAKYVDSKEQALELLASS